MDSKLQAIKVAMLQTVATAGWAYIKQMSDNIVDHAIQASLDADDREQGENLRLIAKAKQAAFRELFGAIENARAFDNGDSTEWLSDLGRDFND